MNKIFLGGLVLALCGGVAVAQEADTLFPELKGQFEQAPVSKPEKLDLSVEREEEIEGVEEKKAAVKKNDPEEKAEPAKTEEPKEDDKNEGKLIIEVQNVNGVLPYARNLAYCSAEAVLTNETNQLLTQLSLIATYKGMPKDLNFSNVSKKKKLTKKFMLIGLPCEGIKGMPEIEIKSCKLGKKSEKACKELVQFIPPRD